MRLTGGWPEKVAFTLRGFLAIGVVGFAILLPVLRELSMPLFLFLCVAGPIDSCPLAMEPSQFWTAIANDTNRSSSTRRIAVIRLVDRHAKAGMTLTAFCRLLDNPSWLNKKDITNWNKAWLLGLIPVDIVHENSTTFSFLVFSGLPGDVYAVYFRVSGEIDVETLWQLFHGEKPAHFKDATIVEIATSAGRGHLHLQKLKEDGTSRFCDPNGK
jgi:hypothetical protein